MFDGLLKSKFYSKCKSATNVTKTRIGMIMKKRNAMQKYLKNDIADLLKNGLDSIAYSRAEGLLVELNLSSCYDFVEQFCACISSHLSVMSKQRECPEECREAVPSLMFAAARFADLPELRDLRNLFTERYGNSVESYVNQEFVQKLKSMPPAKDTKLQLMQDIALESSIEWDSKALEQKLYKPPASEQDWSKNTNADKYKLPTSKDESVSKIDNQNAESKLSDVRDSTVKETNQDPSSCGRKEVTNDGLKLHTKRENVTPEEDNRSHPSYEARRNTLGKDIQAASIDHNGLQNHPNSVKSSSKEEVDDKKHVDYRSIPPPYIKPNVSKNETSLQVPPTGSGGEGIGPGKSNDGELNHHHDESVGEAKPIPRSVRQRRLKPPPGHDNIGSAEGDGRRKMNLSEKKEEATELGLKILNEEDHDQRDEEERQMDRLLKHYSEKQSAFEPSKIQSALKPPPSHQYVIDAGKATQQRSKDGLPTRATSLPAEPSSPTDATKGHARASSFQPEMMNPPRHVHPKLPDCDDFLARFAALRGK